MNFGDMKTQTRRKLNELAANFWSDEDVAAALNKGLAEMADATEYYERYVNIPLLSGRGYYNLKNVIDDTFLSPRRAFNTITGRWLIPTDTREMDYHTYVQWELTSGQPERYLMRGNWWVCFFPRPDSDGREVRFYHTAIPPEMEDDDDEPGFPREFHQGVVDYALYDCMAQDREEKKALAFWASYKVHEAGLHQYVERRISYDRMSGLQG